MIWKNGLARDIDSVVRLIARKMNFRAALRYGAVGLLQNGIAYCLTLVLILYGWQAWEVFLVLTPPSTLLSFFLNKNWSFSSTERRPGELKKYLAAYSVSYVFAVTFTWTLEHIGVPSWLAALVTVCTAALGLYCALNFWIFAPLTRTK